MIKQTGGINRIYNHLNAHQQPKNSQDSDLENAKKRFSEEHKRQRRRIRLSEDYYQPAGYSVNMPLLHVQGRMAGTVREYDFLDPANIAVIAFNFVIGLHVEKKRFNDLADVFVTAAKSDFFGGYGEMLIDLSCSRLEKAQGELVGLDEILEIKKKIYGQLNHYMKAADDLMDSLKLKYPREWKAFLGSSERNAGRVIKEWRSVNAKENFFVEKLKEILIHENEKFSLPILLEALREFLS